MTRSTKRKLSDCATNDITSSSVNTPNDYISIVDMMTFAQKCKWGCKHRAKNIKFKRSSANSMGYFAKVRKALITQLDNFKMGSDSYKQQYIMCSSAAGKSYQLRHPQKNDIQHMHKESVYQLPLISSDDFSTTVCRDCFRHYHDHLSTRGWQRIKSTSTNLHYTTEFIGTQQHLNSLVKGNKNVAVVIASEVLDRYEKSIILSRPEVVTRENQHTIKFSDNVTINGAPIQSSDKSIFEINSKSKIGSSFIIVVPKEELDSCIKGTGVRVQYEYADSAAWVASSSYVILAVSTVIRDKEEYFHPTKNDSAIMKRHKPNVIQRGAHFNTNGVHHHFGCHSSYEQHQDGSPQSIAEYKAINTDEDTYEKVKNNASSAIQMTIDANEAINELSGFELVESSAAATITNRIFGNFLNTLNNHFESSRYEIKCAALENDDGTSAIFPMLNICEDASTGTFHTEDDQGMTLILVPYQDSSKSARFLFKIHSRLTLSVSMMCGTALLFNGRLITHRQELTQSNTNSNECKVPIEKINVYWNFGLYANRKYDQFMLKKICREFDFLLEHSRKWLSPIK